MPTTIPPCCPRAFSSAALLPDRMLLELVQYLRRADGNAVWVSGHGLAAGLERVAAPELDRVERQRRRRLVDQHLQRGHRLQRAVTAHRARGDAARMQRDRGDIDLRNVVDADRRGGADGRDAARKIGEAAAIQHVIGGECHDLAGRAVDADARAHLEGVTLDAALKLLIAVVRQPHRTAGQEHRRQRDIEREGRMIASAESAAHVGKHGLDARRLERSPRVAEHVGKRLQPPRKATARRARARGFCAPACTSRARLPARGTPGRRIAFRTRGRASATPDWPRQARRGSARHRWRPWRRRRLGLDRERRPYRALGILETCRD